MNSRWLRGISHRDARSAEAPLLPAVAVVEVGMRAVALILRIASKSPPLFSIFRLYVKGPCLSWNLYALALTLVVCVDSQGDRAMSLHLKAGIDFPSQLPTATAPYFLLGLNSTGSWVIRDTTG